MIELPEPAAMIEYTPISGWGIQMHRLHLALGEPREPIYTADQIKQAIRDALEEAAKEFDRRAVLRDGGPAVGWYEPNEPAEIVRELKEAIQ